MFIKAKDKVFTQTARITVAKLGNYRLTIENDDAARLPMMCKVAYKAEYASKDAAIEAAHKYFKDHKKKVIESQSSRGGV